MHGVTGLHYPLQRKRKPGRPCRAVILESDNEEDVVILSFISPSLSSLTYPPPSSSSLLSLFPLLPSTLPPSFFSPSLPPFLPLPGYSRLHWLPLLLIHFLKCPPLPPTPQSTGRAPGSKLYEDTCTCWLKTWIFSCMIICSASLIIIYGIVFCFRVLTLKSIPLLTCWIKEVLSTGCGCWLSKFHLIHRLFI